MNTLKKIIPLFLLVLCVITLPANAQKQFIYSGTTTTKAIGKEEVREKQILRATENSDVLNVALSDFEAFGHKGIGISGTLVRDKEGKITEYKNLKITGISGVKIHSITGTITNQKVDVILVGKLAGIFNFKIYYKASRKS